MKCARASTDRNRGNVARREAGQSFIELCLVLSILGTLASASFLGMSAENRQVRRGQEELAAAALATRILERARAGDIDVAALPVGTTLQCPVDGSARTTLNACEAVLETKAVPRHGQTSEQRELKPVEVKLIEVKVIVSWRNSGAQGRSKFEVATWIRVPQ